LLEQIKHHQVNYYEYCQPMTTIYSARATNHF